MPAAPPPAGHLGEIRPISGRATAAIAGLVLAGAAELFVFLAHVDRLGLVNRVLGGEAVTPTEAVDSDDLVRTAAWCELAAIVVCAVTFLMWLHRVVRNNRLLSTRSARFSPAAAVGWWFVPFANLVVPFRVVAEAWRNASMLQRADGIVERLPGALIAWWAFFAGGNVVGRVSVVLSNDQGMESLRNATETALVASGALVVAAALGVWVVLGLTARQEAAAGGAVASGGLR